MNESPVEQSTRARTGSPDEHDDTRVLDVLVVGCGPAGLEALHKVRRLGYDALAVDAADGVGGTWYWNRYPGARLDSESYSYGYFFSEEVLTEWNWSEHFCGQQENERYFNFVVEKWGLRPYLRLGQRVEAAHFDDGDNTWTVTTAAGSTYRARFLVTAIGILSDPRYPDVPGLDLFEGESFHTARWPHGEVDLRGRRVAVIGTGASGVQTISAIGPIVGSLTVFQRSPNWCPPLNNDPITDLEMAEIKGRYPAIRMSTQTSRGGFVHSGLAASAFDFTADRRREWYEHLYACRGFARLYTNFPELVRDKMINNEFSAFLAEKIRGRIDDPATADKLIPTSHGFGQRRPPYETRYYEVYNQPNVELVDTSETPMVEVTAHGVRTTEQAYEFDVIIYATGFHSVTGAFTRIDIRGTDDVLLRDVWRDGPVTWAGLGTPGFPNLLVLGGPQAMGGNIPRCIEKQVDFLTTLLPHLDDEGLDRVEVTPQACEQWAEHITSIVSMTLYSETQTGWFWSDNGDSGKTFGIYPGGNVEYGRRLAACASNGYPEFVLSRHRATDSTASTAGAAQ